MPTPPPARLASSCDTTLLWDTTSTHTCPRLAEPFYLLRWLAWKITALNNMQHAFRRLLPSLPLYSLLPKQLSSSPALLPATQCLCAASLILAPQEGGPIAPPCKASVSHMHAAFTPPHSAALFTVLLPPFACWHTNLFIPVLVGGQCPRLYCGPRTLPVSPVPTWVPWVPEEEETPGSNLPTSLRFYRPTFTTPWHACYRLCVRAAHVRVHSASVCLNATPITTAMVAVLRVRYTPLHAFQFRRTGGYRFFHDGSFASPFAFLLTTNARGLPRTVLYCCRPACHTAYPFANQQPYGTR